MKLTIDRTNKTFSIEGEYTVAEFLLLLEETPYLEDYKVIPTETIKIAEKVIYRDRPNLFDQITQPYKQVPYVQPNTPYYQDYGKLTTDNHTSEFAENSAEYTLTTDNLSTDFTFISMNGTSELDRSEVDCFSGQPINQYANQISDSMEQ